MKVLTYNTLAKGLSVSFAEYPGYQKEHLPFEQRLPLLLAEIKRHGADVVCLQEVAKGTEHQFIQGLPSYHKIMFVNGTRSHGLLMLARHGMDGPVRFGALTNSTQMYLAATFDGVTVVTTHLKAKPPHAEIRLEQVKGLISKFGSNNVIYVGDFNAEPDEACIQEMRCGMKMTQTGYTTCKRREERIVRKIDYIFIPADWSVMDYSDPPDLTDDEVFPNERQGSDHVAVSATVSA